MRTSTKLSIVLGGCAALVATAWIATRARDAVATEEARATPASDATQAPSAKRVPATLASDAPSATEANERVPEVAEIRGRLIDATTGLPIPGRTIELRARAKPVASVFAALAFANGAPAQSTLQLAGALNAWREGIVLRAPPPTLAFESAGGAVELRAEGSQPIQLRWARMVLGERTGAVDDASTGAAPASDEPPASEEAPELDEDASGGDEHGEGSSLVDVVIAASMGASASEPEVDAVQVTGDVRIREAQEGVLVTIDDLRARALEASLRTTVASALAGAGDAAAARDGVTFFLGGAPFLPNDAADPTIVLPALLDSAQTPRTKLPARTTTDAKGWFRFDCPEEASVELVLVANDGEWIPDTTYSFAGVESPCREAIEWRVEIAAGRVVEGRVLDARTLRPLAAMLVSLDGRRGRSETVETDAHGRFATKAAFPLGHVAIALKDGDDPARIDATPIEVELAPSRTEDELVVLASIGPTFRFAFAHADFEDGHGKRVVVEQELDASNVEARLVGAAPWPGSVEAAGLDPDANPFVEWRSVRVGSPVAEEENASSLAASHGWLRYAIAPRLPRGAQVELRTHDARYACTAELAGGPGVQPVVLQRTASVQGRLVLPEGVADASAYRVVAARAGGARSGRGAAYAEAACGEDGTFDLRGVDVTCVRSLEIWKDDARVRTIAVELRPGETRLVDLEP